MQSVIQTITINKVAKEVFDFAINPENTPKWVDSVAKEETNEAPTKLGTIYRNCGEDGVWAEFEITDFEAGRMFEMTKLDDNHHVKYTFEPSDDGTTQLEYCVWVPEGEVSTRFSVENIKSILGKFKEISENR